MKIRIAFRREAKYHIEELTLLLMRYFMPTKVFVFGTSDEIWSRETVKFLIEGALPINPFEAMEQINEAMAKKVPDWSLTIVIDFIEMENQEEKEKIATWVLINKLKPKTLI